MNDNDTPTPGGDPVTQAFFTLHHDLPRQGPGSDATTRHALETAGPLPEHPRVLDAGCGPGRSTLLLAEEAGAHVTAVDLHQPYLDSLVAEAARRGPGDRITVVNCSMDQLPVPDHSFDVIWAEESVYTVGFDVALRAWRRLLAPGGVLVATEIEWTVPSPAASVRAYRDAVYPLRTQAANTDAAQAAGYRLHASGRCRKATGGTSTTRRSPSARTELTRSTPACRRPWPHTGQRSTCGANTAATTTTPSTSSAPTTTPPTPPRTQP